MWYIGVVENNKDEQKLGRVQVRIFGLHTAARTTADADGNLLTTASLPWALPIAPNVGNISENSVFSIPDNGSWVLCSFFDEDKQSPFYIGTIPRLETVTPTFTEGFSDPTQALPDPANKGRQSISKLATGEGEPSVKASPQSGTIVTEPASEYGTQYPFNNVIRTRSGHSIEIDDTPSSERIQVIHKSGTFIELRSDGKAIVHTKAAQYLISENTLNIYGTGDINIESAGDINLQAGGDINAVAGANINNTAPTAITNTTPNNNTTGNVASTGGNVSDSVSTIQSMRDTYNTHTHNENDSAPSPTQVPNQLMS